MGKSCEEIPRKIKDVCNSRKLRKVGVIYKTNKPVLFKKYMSYELEAREELFTQKIAVLDLFSVTNQLKARFFYKHRFVLTKAQCCLTFS